MYVCAVVEVDALVGGGDLSSPRELQPSGGQALVRIDSEQTGVMGAGGEHGPAGAVHTKQPGYDQRHRRIHEIVTMSDVRKCPLMQTKGFVDGKWVDGHSEETFPVTNPATQEVVARVSVMDKVDVERAIEAAVHSQRDWKRTPPRVRAELLKNWNEQVLAHIDELAMLASAESGKPISEARGEVRYAASFIEFYAGACMQSGGFVVPSTTFDQRMIAIHEPVGVCAIITPWNFPLAMITRKLAPCLAAGCTAVVRPADETPLSALALARLAQLAEIPAGVVNVVVSPHETAHEVDEALATNDSIRKLSFTGSTRVGQILMKQAASTIKRVSLELGGNAPFIVFDDSDLEAAVAGLIATKFRNTGQTCVCTNRVFVHNSVFETFLHMVEKQVKQLKMGTPLANETQLGPLINQKTFDEVQAIVKDAVDKGASIVTGGNPARNYGGLYFEPTVLVDVDDTMRIYHEEVFGPVVPMFPFESEHEVVEKANDTTVGLAGYYYTKDLGRAWRVAASLEVGMVGVNTGAISNAQAPFGGVKQSGLGREGSVLGLNEYIETKLISMSGLLP